MLDIQQNYLINANEIIEISNLIDIYALSILIFNECVNCDINSRLGGCEVNEERALKCEFYTFLGTRSKAEKVFAVATEDMDALTFGSNVLLRHMTFSEARKMPIQEIHLKTVLEGLNLTHDQFIDLCILLGCDYTDSIRGIGPKRAIELITKHNSIEEILNNIDTKVYSPPENWNYKAARQLFVKPEITDPDTIEVKWNDPDEDGLVKYLCGDKQFNEERVRNGAKKLMKARGSTTQGRLDGFFTVLSSSPAKRKVEPKKESSNKRGKGTSRGRGRAK